MSSVEISTTGSEPLRRLLTSDGAPLTGATVRCDVRRSSDGLVLDFADSTFKALGSVGTRYRALAEVSAVDWAGLYEGTALDLAGIVGGVAVGTVLTVTYYSTAPAALTLDQDELRVVAAPPTAVQISDVVRAGVTTDHGAGSYLTASGFATPTTIADAVEEIEAFGQVNWVTATNFATPGAAMTLAAGALTSTAIGAGYVAAMQAGLALEATLTAMKGASFDGATDSLRASRVLVSALPAAVWATAHGTPSVDTFGWLVWRHAQWGTEIADKAIVGQDLLLRSLDLATTYATVRLRDKDGGVITPATGEPARFDPT